MFAQVTNFLVKSESTEISGINDKKLEQIYADEKFDEKFIKFKKFINKLFVVEIEKILILKSIIFQKNKTGKMSSRDDDIKIPRFDGRDYNLWKKRILLFLRLKECYDPATRERTNADEQTDWNKKNLKAMNIIYCSITNEQLEFIGEEDSALKIMNKFDQMYLKESTALQICVRNKLNRLRLQDFEDSSTFFLEFEKLFNELKSAGATVTQREKLDYMLKTLPDTLSYLGDLIDTVQQDERNCEFLKNKITMWEMKHTNESNKKKHSVFKVNKSNNNCYQCGKPGHIAKTCWSKERSTERSNETSTSGGDFQPQQQYRGAGRGATRGAWRGGSRGRGRGRGAAKQRSDGGGYYSERNDNSSHGTFLARVERDYDSVAYTSDSAKVEWILDSGCSDHIVNDDTFFAESINLQNPINVKLGDGRILKGTKIGKIITYFIVNNRKMKITLNDVYFVKEMDKNLISFAKVTARNKIISIGNTAKIYNESDHLIGIAYKQNGIYKINSTFENKYTYVGNTAKTTQKEKFHKLLGHVNFKYLEKMCKDRLVEGMPNELEHTYLKCGTCFQNKMHNLKFENDRHKANDILETVHTDLNGPHSTVGYDGSKYFLTFIDDYSKCAMVYTIKNKNEVTNCFIDYINRVENLTGKRVKRVRCDNGREYINKEMNNIISQKGIVLDPCPPYTHELNGTAERYNRSIMNSARCLLSDSKVNLKYWPEVIKTAAYLKNRTITNTIENKTPFEILFKKKPNIKNLKLYGSKVFVRVPEIKRNSKWDRKADSGILVGYESNGYRILVGNKIIISRHVEIVENDENLVGLNGSVASDNESEISSSEESVFDEETNEKRIIDKKKDNLELNENLSANRNKARNKSEKYINDEKSIAPEKRERKRTDFYGNPVSYNVRANVASAENPLTFREALESKDSDL